MSPRRAGGVPLQVAMAPLPTPRGNPFVRQMADALGANGCEVVGASLRTATTGDVLHLHWPDHAVNRETTLGSVRGAVKLLLMGAIVRVRGGAVVWTVHNLKAHDGRHPAVERVFWPLLTRLVSGCVFLTAAGRHAALAALPGLRRAATVVVPHGSYRGVYPEYTGSAGDARRSLGLADDAAPLAFFGQIRPYKNLPGLLAAFADLADPDARLVVAGDGSDAALLAEVHRAATEDGRVLVAGRIADDDVQRVMASAVGVVLPYREVFNSGSLFLALSHGRPVLVPRTDVFMEIGDEVGPGWVEYFEPPLTADDLASFARRADELVASGAAPDLTRYDWDGLGPQIVAFYRRLLARRSEASL